MANSDFDMFGPFSASIRKHLGELADAWMQAKIEFIKKLQNQIAMENRPEELDDLRNQLSNALISDEDIAGFEAKSAKLLAAAKNNITAMIEIKKIFNDAKQSM